MVTKTLTAKQPFALGDVKMRNECAICCRPLNTENPKVYFCSKCYHDWEKEIKAKVGWIKFLINNELRRRRWDTYSDKGKVVSVQLVYLGNEFDIDSDGNIVRRDNKNG